ncbi:glycosyltransferase family A protein [Kushneria sp. EE4]
MSDRASDASTGCRFFFGIPLRARARCRDWPRLCRNLERTLACLARQQCGDFRVLIACHEPPDIDTHGLDVEFVPADIPLPPLRNDQGLPGSDKPAKKRLLGVALARQTQAPFYFMHLDADDLVHPELVARVLADDNQRGYLIDQGVMFDCITGTFGQCDPLTSPFYQHCGSCAVVYFQGDELPRALTGRGTYFTRFTKHRLYGDVAAAHGRPLTPLPGNMGVYVVNHGENDVSIYRGDRDGKSRFVRRRGISDEHEIARLLALFPELDGFMLDAVSASPLS